jgi:hypothetical protein
VPREGEGVPCASLELPNSDRPVGAALLDARGKAEIVPRVFLKKFVVNCLAGSILFDEFESAWTIDESRLMPGDGVAEAAGRLNDINLKL